MWTSVKQAREHGWNVRHVKDGWQVGNLTIDGWNWRPFFLPTKQRALHHAHTVYSYH